MWPWKRQQTPSAQQDPALEDHIRAVARDLGELRAEVNLLRREWTDTLDKLQSWFGREAARKRAQLHKQLELTPDAAQVPVGDTNGAPAVDKAQLRRIAAQRRFGGGNG